MSRLWSLLVEQLQAPWSPLNVLLFIAAVLVAVTWLPGYLLNLMERGG